MTETNSQLVAATPIYQVEVKIILESRSVQNFTRYLADLPHLLVLWRRDTQRILLVFIGNDVTLRPKSKNVGISERFQLLTWGTLPHSPQNFFVKNLSDRHVLRVIVLHFHLLWRLLSIIIFNGYPAIGNESINERRLHFLGIPSVNKRRETVNRGKQPIKP